LRLSSTGRAKQQRNEMGTLQRTSLTRELIALSVVRSVLTLTSQLSPLSCSIRQYRLTRHLVLQEADVCVDHQLDERLELGLGLPAKLTLGLGGITD
jgi:hypothetical protein